MKKSTILALVILGGATFTGLGVLFTGAFLESLGTGADGGNLPAFLTVSVAAAILVLGIFLGYLYRDSIRDSKQAKEALGRFKKALEFERSERARQGSGLYEAKKTIALLKDQLSQMESRRNEDPSTEQRDLEEEIDELTQHAEQLKSELGRRKHRIADLMAEVSIAQAEAEMEKTKAAKLRASFQSGPLFAPPNEASLKDLLENLVAMDGIEVALVADDYGLVVSSAGDGISTETLAAISTLVADFGPRISDILPTGEMNSIIVVDDDGFVIETRFFDLYGARCALAIAREEDKPHPGLTKKAVKAISARFD